jgi:hypothetical protein
VLYLDGGSIALYDTATRRAITVVDSAGALPITVFTVSRDGRVIDLLREHSDGDVWLAMLKK